MDRKKKGKGSYSKILISYFVGLIFFFPFLDFFNISIMRIDSLYEKKNAPVFHKENASNDPLEGRRPSCPASAQKRSRERLQSWPSGAGTPRARRKQRRPASMEVVNRAPGEKKPSLVFSLGSLQQLTVAPACRPPEGGCPQGSRDRGHSSMAARSNTGDTVCEADTDQVSRCPVLNVHGLLLG